MGREGKAARYVSLPACDGAQEETEPFVIGTIPDQNTNLLQREYG